MTVKGIIVNYLRANGYDGLCDRESECGCSLDYLEPCDCLSSTCEAAHKRTCDGECGFTTDGEPCEWHMVPGPRVEAKP